MKVALDFGLFRDRISGVVEDIIVKYKLRDIVNVPVMTGFLVRVIILPSLKIRYRGTIRATILEYKGFRWNMSANIAWNQNRLTKYESLPDIFTESVGYP
ncbi:MAG: hypothetical protein ACLU4J_14165 [Butyricimonas paravirosa]